MKYDVFICHASEDKDEFVHALAEALEESGLSVWYDNFVLRMGDSLIESINAGLSQSAFGIVVLSPIFLQKDWPKRELSALLAREEGAENVIIPIWHRVKRRKVLFYFPVMAERDFVTSNEPMRKIVRRIFEVVRPRRIARAHYEQGLILQEKDEPEEAMAAYLRSIRLDSTNLDALRKISQLQSESLPRSRHNTATYVKVGTVRFYSKKIGFGVITGEDGKGYWVHASSLEQGTSLNDGARVAFLARFGFWILGASSVRII